MIISIFMDPDLLHSYLLTDPIGFNLILGPVFVRPLSHNDPRIFASFVVFFSADNGGQMNLTAIID